MPTRIGAPAAVLSVLLMLFVAVIASLDVKLQEAWFDALWKGLLVAIAITTAFLLRGLWVTVREWRDSLTLGKKWYLQYNKQANQVTVTGNADKLSSDFKAAICRLGYGSAHIFLELRALSHHMTIANRYSLEFFGKDIRIPEGITEASLEIDVELKNRVKRKVSIGVEIIPVGPQ